MRRLHQNPPAFHGDRVRLRAGGRFKAHFDLVTDLSDGSADEVATVYLPIGMGNALHEACGAFNVVMDAHERGEAVKMLPATTGHLLTGEVA